MPLVLVTDMLFDIAERLEQDVAVLIPELPPFLGLRRVLGDRLVAHPFRVLVKDPRVGVLHTWVGVKFELFSLGVGDLVEVHPTLGLLLRTNTTHGGS